MIELVDSIRNESYKTFVEKNLHTATKPINPLQTTRLEDNVPFRNFFELLAHPTRGTDPNRHTTWGSDPNPNLKPNRHGAGNYLKTGTNPHS